MMRHVILSEAKDLQDEGFFSLKYQNDRSMSS